MQQGSENASASTGARRKVQKKNEERHADKEHGHPSRDSPTYEPEKPSQRQAETDKRYCVAGDGDDDEGDVLHYRCDGNCKHPLLPDCYCGRKRSTDEIFDQWSESKTSNRFKSTTSEDRSNKKPMSVEAPAPMDLLQLIKDDSVATLLSKIQRVAQFLPYAGAVLAVVDTFLPDENQKAVIQWFEKLSNQLEKEKLELVNIIQREAVNLRYCEHIVSIQTAISSSMDIVKARDDADRKRYVEIFKDVCSGQKHTLAMDNLVAGLRCKGTLQINILDRYYSYTGGHLPKVRSLAKELLHLVYAGFIVMCKYETLMQDERFAEEFLNKYTNRMKDVQENIQSIFERCKNEFKENMLIDLNDVLDSSVSNSEAVNSLSSLMSEKYDWLENYCIVCDESFHMDCCFKGNYVSSFERNSKFGAVLYQDITETASDPARQEEVKNVIESLDIGFWSANSVCQEFIAILRGKGIETYGCAVIRPRFGMLAIPYLGFLSIAVCGLKLAALQQKGSSSTAVHFGPENWLSQPRKLFCLVLWR